MAITPQQQLMCFEFPLWKANFQKKLKWLQEFQKEGLSNLSLTDEEKKKYYTSVKASIEFCEHFIREFEKRGY